MLDVVARIGEERGYEGALGAAAQKAHASSPKWRRS
jgi:hypothetical protein